MLQFTNKKDEDAQFKKYLNNVSDEYDSELDEKEKEDEILVKTDEKEFFDTI